MLIVFASLNGNVRRFVQKTGLEAVEINEDLVVTEPFILVTHTSGFGEVPIKVLDFLERDHHYALIRSVAASGNMNWGNNFARSADIISYKYKVPVMMKFEMSGRTPEVEKFIQEVLNID